MVDIVIVLFNSEKWINKCIESILGLHFDKKLLNVILVDNGSTDNSVTIAQSLQSSSCSELGSFQIIETNKNLGFGKASNLGANASNSPFVFFLNIDTEVEPNSLSQAYEYIKNSEPNIAAWELRQFPYESPKHYNPITLNTSWCSAAALIVKREIFEKTEGFDKRFFMYAEDVELSWKIRFLGYKLMYMPKSVVLHHSYTNSTIKPNQYVYSIIGSLYLRYKYGNVSQILVAYFMILVLFLKSNAYKGAKFSVFKALLAHAPKIPSLLFWNILHRKQIKQNVQPIFNNWDYEIARRGSFYSNHHPKNTPLVSIVVRTHKRPLVLKEALFSIANQTYPNIEVIVIEDGQDTSSEMIKKEFTSLNYNFSHTKTNVGRCKTGNIGLGLSKGDYLCFLDDDDLIYPDHVETLVSSIETTDYDAVYANAFETPIDILSKEPYRIKIHKYEVINKQGFNKALLCHHNYIPIQAILFKRALFEQYGGFDERLNVLEDWDLWLRFAQTAKFLYIDKTTSIYRVPFNRNINNARQLDLDNALPILREKHKTYKIEIPASDLALDTIDIIKINTEFIPEYVTEFLKKNKLPFYILKYSKKILYRTYKAIK